VGEQQLRRLEREIGALCAGEECARTGSRRFRNAAVRREGNVNGIALIERRGFRQ
jgi:hypothetical protein